ncbi:MAG: enoyl-CoA hydratase/isomerase family protein [Candidatus Marinimicrobia bacterium]|nr:enoyl-CoA hydratase/isomerase family protein [Candidatus Neomarinimicrobiota bacterium]
MVTLEILDTISIIKIDRPKQLNALSQTVIELLDNCFNEAINNNEVKVIILSGTGNKAFIAGADIIEMSKMTPNQAKKYSILGQKLTQKIENSPKPVIGAINGFALGGGCEFAMACHFRYASDNAKFGQPEVGIGLIAGFGGTQRLRRLVGKGMANELLLSGKLIDANEALRIGLINKIVPQNELLNECIKIANKIRHNSPKAIEYTINALNEGDDNPISLALEIEAKYFEKVFKTTDRSEGLNAFIEKRKPTFKGK